MISHSPGGSGYHVEIDGESHNRPAFWCLDGEKLIRSRVNRVKSAVRPGVPGRKFGDSRPDSIELELRYEFDGSHDLDGVASSDPETTLNETLAWFMEAVVDPTNAHSVTVTVKGGEVWAGELVVTRFEAGDGPEECAAMLIVSMPDGRLTPAGS